MAADLEKKASFKFSLYLLCYKKLDLTGAVEKEHNLPAQWNAFVFTIPSG